jgi:diadenosine tetraphosphate (Ap4A) HIT family hydrolase
MPMSSTANCPFCSIEPRERVIRSGELFVSFLSGPKLTRGHVLVVPTRHVEAPFELAAEETTAIFGEIRRLQRLIIKHLAPGVDTWQKYQPFVPEGSNNKVDHVHFHVLPRRPDDRLFMTPEASKMDAFTTLSDEECKELTKLLEGA